MSTLKWKIRNLGTLILLALTLVFGEFLISHFVMDIKEKQVFILFFLFSKMARNNQCFLASHMVFHTPIYTLSTRPAPPYVASPPTGASSHLSSMSPSHTTYPANAPSQTVAASLAASTSIFFTSSTMKNPCLTYYHPSAKAGIYFKHHFCALFPVF